MFSRQSMQCFTDSKKDVMYDYLQREDVNWRSLHVKIAQQVVKEHKLNSCETKAFVVDDSVKIRRGKKMAGVSCHFDHLAGKTVMGQQTLTWRDYKHNFMQALQLVTFNLRLEAVSDGDWWLFWSNLNFETWVKCIARVSVTRYLKEKG